MGDILIFSDGSAYPRNPGRIRLGAVLFNTEGVLLASISQEAGWGTSNQSEYMSLVAALELAHAQGFRRVICKSDSELMVRQLKGEYEVRAPNLKRHFQEVQKLMKKFDVFSIGWHSRDSEYAQIADAASRGVTFNVGDEKWLILKTLNQRPIRRIHEGSPSPPMSGSKSVEGASSSQATGL